MTGVIYMENCQNGEYEFTLPTSIAYIHMIRIKFTVNENGEVAYQKPEI